MPSPLPLSSVFYYNTLASGLHRCIQDGAFSRRVLPRLLLGFNELIVCCRRDEHLMDSCDYPVCSVRKGVASWGCRWTLDGPADDRGRWDIRVYWNISNAYYLPGYRRLPIGVIVVEILSTTLVYLHRVNNV